MKQEKRIVGERDDIGRMVSRMAHEVLERMKDEEGLVLIGIRSRGAYLARRIAGRIAQFSGRNPSVGIVDITPFRDDRPAEPSVVQLRSGEVPVSVDDRNVILVDDVINTGRTIRAALERLNLLGKPKRILVAALVDRGARELPIRPDIVGKNIDVADTERVNVMLEETDGTDQIIVGPYRLRTAP